MPIFISYSRADSKFVDRLAENLVSNRHHVWMDRWELNIGDSLIDKIQQALTGSDAILIVLSKTSVASEWCRKELNSGLIRELTEKKVIVLPCVIDDCEIPLFLREKLYADFRNDPDEAFRQINDSLARIINHQQGRIESPDFFTDWSYDWKQHRNSGLWLFRWTFVDHGAAIEYCMLTQCEVHCNDIASNIFSRLNENDRQKYIYETMQRISQHATALSLKLRIQDAFEVSKDLVLRGPAGEIWIVELASRRMGVDTGKDTLVHVDQILERTLVQMKDAAQREALPQA